MSTNREMFLQFLLDIRGYQFRTADKINKQLDKIEMMLGKPFTEVQTGSEIEHAILRSAESRKRAYNGGFMDNGAHTRFRMGIAVAMFMRWMYSEGLIIKNIYPKNTFREPFKREADWLKPEQVNALLNCESLSVTEQSMVRFMLDTALRREEFQNVKKTDLDKKLRLVHVPFAKGMKFRSVPITDKTLWWIEMYESMKSTQLQIEGSQAVRPISEYLFSDANGDRLGYALIGDIFHQISRKVGFRVHAHALRHTAATTWIQSGVVSQIETMRFLGHESIQETSHYIHSTGAQLAELQRKVYDKMGIK